jgi:hypothetical protein
MKQCPQCLQTFSDDYLFCLSDGTSLVSFFDSPDETTVIRPSPFIQQQIPYIKQGVSPMFAYLLIGLIALIIGGAIVFWLRLDSNNYAKNQNLDKSNSAGKQSKDVVANSNLTESNIQSERDLSSPIIKINLSGRWTGDWMSSSAFYTADVSLTDNGSGKVQGQIVWTLKRTKNSQKIDKVGFTAVEYVQGSFNPTTRMLVIRGYRKDDPYNLVILDNYQLTLAEDNSRLGGKSKTGQMTLHR